MRVPRFDNYLLLITPIIYTCAVNSKLTLFGNYKMKLANCKSLFLVFTPIVCLITFVQKTLKREWIPNIDRTSPVLHVIVFEAKIQRGSLGDSVDK